MTFSDIPHLLTGFPSLSGATSAVRPQYRQTSSRKADVILRRRPRIAAIEVKTGAKTMLSRDMESFNQRFPPRHSLLAGKGSMPLDRFLTAHASHWFEGV